MEYWHNDIAKSNQTECWECGKVILKGTPRTKYESGTYSNFVSYKYFHAVCTIPYLLKHIEEIKSYIAEIQAIVDQTQK